MQVDPVALVAIVGMALVTYGTRAGGVWLMGRVRQTPRVETWLRHIPGAVLISLVAPEALAGGPADVLAVAVTALIAWRTRNFLLAVGLGVAIAWLLRQVIVA